MRLQAAFLTDPDLQRIMGMLTEAGHRALIVGGAVRNALLGLEVGDIDLATDAHPEEVIALSRAAGLNPVPTGIEHGTVTVVANGRGFEVTTFRRDVENFGRHARVAFSDDISEDAARRDFTMNALYATQSGEVLDPLGGMEDLRARRLRFVGPPEARITEDYLRILRFFRFMAWYGRETDPEAIRACAHHASGLNSISAERIGGEMRKLLSAPDPADAMQLMDETSVLGHILPGARADKLPALIATEGERPPHWLRRLAVLDPPGDTATRLRLSKAEARRLEQLCAHASGPVALGNWGYRLGTEIAQDLALLHAAHGARLPAGWVERIEVAAAARLPIAARDLMPALTGPALGEGLRAAEEMWIRSDFAAPAPALIDAALLAGEDKP